MCDTLLFQLGLAAVAAIGGFALAKPNYQFEKRQRELEKKRKKEEKRQLAQAAKNPAGDGDADGTAQPGAESDDAGTTAGS